MAAFFENPLFLFVDETESILPIFRSPEYESQRKIVELADVGCDTETFPTHFLCSKFNRRRGGAESFGSARKIAKRRNEKPINFSARAATVLDSFENRREKYTKSKPSRNNRSDDSNNVYASTDYNSRLKDSYDDWKFSKDARCSDYYNEFVVPRNMAGRFRKECPSQSVRYSRDFEAPFPWSNYRESDCRQRKNACPTWIDGDDENVYAARNIDVRSRYPLYERRKRTKIFPGANDDFNVDVERRKGRVGKRREQEDVPFDYFGSVDFPKNDAWDLASLENETNYEESTSSNSVTATNRRRLWETTSQNLDSQRTHANFTESENSELLKTYEENSSASSSKNPIKDTRYETSKSNATTKETFRSNLPDTNAPRLRSTGVITDQWPSNPQPTEKATTNAKLRSVIERRNNTNYATPAERRTETADRRHRDNSGNTQTKLSNKHLNKTGQSVKNTSKYVAGPKSTELTLNSRAKSVKKNTEKKGNDRTVPSRSVVKEVAEDEGASASQLPSVLPQNIKVEKSRKISRLPLRTWKRLRTREPVDSHLKSEATTAAADSEKLLDEKIALEAEQRTSKRVENDDGDREKIASEDRRRRDDLKPSNRYRRGPLVTDKSGSALADLKGLKGTKNLNASRGTFEQRKKRI